MVAVDTNVLVRLISRDDPRQLTAAEAFIEKGVWVSALVLAEAIWVLRTTYEFTHETLAASIELLLSNDKLTVQDADAVAAALELFRAKPSLGFADCLILQLARKAGHLPLGTFDRRLARVEGTQKL
jgi:predicted nucleic-acid-binding protein